jgi:type I restriction enzyme S subunit
VTHYQPYSEHREETSGELGAIPSHWDHLQIKFCLSIPITDGPHETPEILNEGIPFISAEAVKDGQLDFSKKRGFISPEEHKRFSQKYKPKRGDVYMVKSGATTGNVARVETDQEFNIWSPLAALRPDSAKATTDFTYFFMLSKPFRHSVELGWSYGTQQNIGMGVVANLEMPAPPLAEQKQIAAFLDWKTGQIDVLIARKQELLEKLKEKRLAVITQAVTRGLNPAAPLRDSGISWLGQVPQHWDVKRLSRVTASRCDGPFGSGLKSEHYSDEGVRVVRLQNIEFAEFDGEDKAYIDPDYYHELGDHDVYPGDLLVAGLGDTNNPVGRACRAPDDLGPAMVKADCFRYRLEAGKADSQFLAYQMSVTAMALAGALAAGVTRARMNLSLTSTRILAFPPIDEQIAIASFLNGETEKFHLMTTKVREAIDRLTEYRTALITAATTGKIDVRDVKVPELVV